MAEVGLLQILLISKAESYITLSFYKIDSFEISNVSNSIYHTFSISMPVLRINNIKNPDLHQQIPSPKYCATFLLQTF